MISEGCRQCAKGGKLVLFVSGTCERRDCFYCPLSETRKDTDTVYANERPVSHDADVIEEAEKMDALGSSITGGEPLEVLDRTCHYIDLLKTEFGGDHHIHLYTAVPGDKDTFKRLSSAGLDEIRFHPPYAMWGNLHGTEWEQRLYDARDAGLDPAFEIPGIRPEQEFIEFIEEGAADFCNINEFEMTEGNHERMRSAGFERDLDHISAVNSPTEKILEEMGSHEKVYFCTAQFKDAAQHRERLKRTAENVRRPFDEITDDGTLVYGVTSVDPDQFDDLGVPDEYYSIKSDHIELAWWLLEEMIENGDIASGEVIEQYPTIDQTIVERTPLAQ
ncbi:radical SAM protein [Salinarchaeum sp. IM2453]|uniref:radical SAM protein n=1 Tax=Salinarchaeum sp. IM2453 TaxID=2862870 RepID=UPI001C8290C5|nr:radical SAM protein [Salinarchaeum sp. IM2453]QZA87432.1 radical SAM protein [Salinarchaeum sp. IM2453]